MNKHTGSGVRKGKRVVIIFNDGTKLIDKYIESKSGKIVLASKTVATSDVRSLSILRGQK